MAKNKENDPSLFFTWSNGTEQMMWLESNCWQCSRYNYPSPENEQKGEGFDKICGLNEALMRNASLDPYIPRCIADTIGTYFPEVYKGKIECLGTCNYLEVNGKVTDDISQFPDDLKVREYPK